MKKMETKYKLKQKCINFSALICILFINASTDLTNRSIVKVETCGRVFSRNWLLTKGYHEEKLDSGYC